jgi:mannose-6-phosphate isomerase-like protein (cupin superfamily)
MEMSDNDSDAVSETHKLPNTGSDLLNMIWKTMQEDKIEQDRGRLETEEK